MRHGNAGNHLSRTTSHRDAMIRNMAASLIQHERIRTTLPKARNLRPFVEKLVTLAKSPTVHRRRLVSSRLHDSVAVSKLFDVLAPRFDKRPGGYTRILKIARRRLGDGGEQAIIEFVERTPKEAAQAEPEAAAEPAKKKGKNATADAS
jgi:large subunit ribosomal protein L17